MKNDSVSLLLVGALAAGLSLGYFAPLVVRLQYTRGQYDALDREMQHAWAAAAGSRIVSDEINAAYQLKSVGLEIEHCSTLAGTSSHFNKEGDLSVVHVWRFTLSDPKHYLNNEAARLATAKAFENVALAHSDYKMRVKKIEFSPPNEVTVMSDFVLTHR